MHKKYQKEYYSLSNNVNIFFDEFLFRFRSIVVINIYRTLCKKYLSIKNIFLKIKADTDKTDFQFTVHCYAQ